MSNDLRDQIHNNMNLKNTDELLEIWQKNDRVEWSDVSFQAVKEILNSRNIETPQQDEPVYEHLEEENDDGTDKNNLEFSELELQIIDDENPPDFYDPFDVLKFGKWLDLAAKMMAIFTILGTLLAFPTTKAISSTYFPGGPDSFSVYIVTIVIMIFNIVIVIPLYYLPLRALSQVLKILMEMEFNS